MPEDRPDPEETQLNFLSQVAQASRDPSGARTFSLMGPNGAGKTRLLFRMKNYLRDQGIRSFILPGSREVYTLEQGQQFRSNDAKNPLRDVMDEIAETQAQVGGVESLPWNAISDFGIIRLLRHVHEEEMRLDNEHRTAIHEWAARDDYAERPRPVRQKGIRTSVLDRLSAIVKKKIVDRASLDGRELNEPFGVVLDSGEVVPISALSLGEKQVLQISLYLFAEARTPFVCLIDEPELHLNESRADELWSEIEAHLESAVFVYATHSPTFATRERVDVCWTINDQGSVEKVEAGESLPPAVLKEVVGARVQVLRSLKPVVFCEDGLSKAIISEVLVGVSAQFISLNGASSVISATRRRSGWEQLAPTNVPFCGVVDRDARTDAEVASLEMNNVIVLPFMEPESFLLHKQLLRRLYVTANGVDSDGVFEDLYFRYLIGSARSLLDTTCEMHVKHAGYYNFQPLKISHDGEKLTDIVAGDPGELITKVRERIDRVFGSIHDRDFHNILKLFPGKELYGRFVRSVAGNILLYAEPEKQLRSYMAISGLRDDFASLPEVVSLRQQLMTKLGL